MEGSFTNLPFGDGWPTAATSDPYGFAMLDYDSETQTDHAQFRQYSSAEGRWLSPDPYYGSYDLSSPQSMNRYVYVLNNPLSFVDPLGLYYVVKCSNSYDNEVLTVTCDVEWVDGGGGGGDSVYLPIGPGTGIGIGTDTGGGGNGPTAPNSVTKPIGTPKTSAQCSIYQDGSATGAALSKICQAFPNDPKSNQIRGCLQSLYNPGSGYVPIPVIIPPGVPGAGGTDVNSLLPGTGAHLGCFANAAGLL